MGSKSSHFYQSDRPESGGANKDDMKDKTGQHEQDKQKVESHRAKLEEESESLIPKRGENPEQARLKARRSETRGESGEG
jgi:hypothetical protein